MFVGLRLLNSEVWLCVLCLSHVLVHYYLLTVEEHNIPALDVDKAINESEIREYAIIYKKGPLNEYHKQINLAAQEICGNNPTMLRSRLKLLLSAQEKVSTTYQFKKGKSRSKRLAIQSNPSMFTPKRKKISKDFRLERMKTVEEELKHLKERISYKGKRRPV